MQTLKITQSCLNFKHINKNSLKKNKLFNKSLILSRNKNLIKYTNNKIPTKSKSKNELIIEKNKLLSKYLESIKCNINVWGSSVIEFNVSLDNLKYLRNKNRFLRKFRNIELTSNGSKYIPNVFQLASIRPQLSGSDLLINSPKGSGKTFMYLLPHLITNYLYNNNEFYKSNINNINQNNTNIDLNELDNININGYNHRIIVLLPTIDLVIDESRTANSCFKKFKKVSGLLYKDLVLNNLNQALEADIIYSTPKTFLKFLIKFNTISSTIKFIIVDESERIITGEFASLLVRIKDLLPIDAQFVFLSNFTHNHLLHQFTSRFLKLNFKIISFINNTNESIKNFNNNPKNISKIDYNDLESISLSNRVTKHIYGPIRDIKDHVKIYNYINNIIIDENKNEIKLEVGEQDTEEDNNKENKVMVKYENIDNRFLNMDTTTGGSNDKVEGSGTTDSSNKNIDKQNNNVKLKEYMESYNSVVKNNCPIVYDLENKIKRNMELIINNNRSNINNNYYKIDYVLYEPSKFVEALLNELDINKKTLVYFPTVKMCQFCYLYFKHYLKLFNRESIENEYVSIKNIDENKNEIKEINGIFENNNIENKNKNIKNNKDIFMFYDFHTCISLDKRRFVMDNFKLANRGILFCTNLAIGVNFNNVNKIIQISFTFNIYELLNKFQFSFYNTTDNSNKENNRIERVLLLNNLDGHILYEYYKNDIDVVLKRTFTKSVYQSDLYSTFCNNSSTNEKVDGDLATTDGSNKENKDQENDHNNNKIDYMLNSFFQKPENNISKKQLEWDIHLLSSCELMYRSLLGYYCENSIKLKLEKWTIPSFFNEFTSSFGISHNFKVSKQFASRTQLLNSPGLEISNNYNRKTDLMASLKSYPGFISKSKQSRILI